MATIILNWTPVNDANSTGQIVQRSLASGGGWSDIASLAPPENTYSDTTVVLNTLYTYRIVNVCLEGGPTESSTVTKGKPDCPDLLDPSLSSGSATIFLPTLTGDAVYGAYSLLDSTNTLVVDGAISPNPSFQGPLAQVLSGLGSNENYTYTFEVIVGTDKIVCEKSFTSIELINCVSYTISTSSAQGQTSAYIDCTGGIGQVTIGGVSGYDATTFCAKEGSVILANECSLTANGPCGEGNIINVTGAYGSMEPCIGGTIDDYMSASVTLDAPVSMDTNVNVNVYWTQLVGGSCASPNTQGFTVFIPAGQNSGSINACNQGAYFPQGAYICSAAVTGHDNTIDTINF
jgi:hypothetical protein